MLKKMNVHNKLPKFISSIKIALLFCGILLSFSGCDRVATVTLPEGTSASGTQPLTVMTYNVYVGGSAEAILAVENLIQIPSAVADMYNNVIASDFPGRAAAIAKSIKTYQPHLIGLQEISLIRSQSPGDSVTGGTVPAEEVVLDFLPIFMDALHAEGLNYQVAVKVKNIDIEMPMFNAANGVDDVRLTDYDVILSRSDVLVSRPVGANFEHALIIENLGLQVDRGYTAVDATVDGKTYRFVNTHLESFEAQSRTAQAQELVDILQTETLPIVLLGDFNAEAPTCTAYQLILSAGYIDTWQADSEGTGNTCCQDPDILNPVSNHFERIDQIFVRNVEGITDIATTTIGDKPSDRLPSGLWPSDHAGVVAQITLD